MKERPVLFSGPMVRAILAGHKTQTRRVVKGPIGYLGGSGGEADLSSWGWFFDGPDHHGYMVLARGMNQRHDHGCISIPCPYGQPGDRLWVRETLKMRDGGAWEYAADGTLVQVPSSDSRRVAAMLSWAHHKEGETCVSIHMPHWASRLTLEVTEVRVQRLQEISEEDARAEGVEANPYYLNDGTLDEAMSIPARRNFEALWDSINGERPGCSWADSPWVWCVSFRRAE